MVSLTDFKMICSYNAKRAYQSKTAAVVLDYSRMGVTFEFFPTVRIRKIPRKIKRLWRANWKRSLISYKIVQVS